MHRIPYVVYHGGVRGLHRIPLPCGDARRGFMKTRIVTAVIAALAMGAAVCVSGCCKVPTSAQSQAFAALNQAWPSVELQANRGAEAMLAAGDTTEAGKAVLDARTESFGQLLADLQSGGQ